MKGSVNTTESTRMYLTLCWALRDGEESVLLEPHKVAEVNM